MSKATSEYFGPTQPGNPPSANPQSVNPQSVNPMSVNPMSVNPSSVKSDEPKSVESPEKKVPLAPKDAYNSAMDEFLAICDQIEANLVDLFAISESFVILQYFVIFNYHCS